MQTVSLLPGNFYHIYNRGVNSEDLFKEKRNYDYFLQQYQFYCADILETYAYALLKNHFHLLVYVKENVQVLKKTGEGMCQLNASKQLSHFFNSYTQSINKAYNRTGPLFESPFERKLIDHDGYLSSVICYCHYNPQLHQFVNDFKTWPFTSFHSIVNKHTELIEVQKVLDWFGGAVQFEQAHMDLYETEPIKHLIPDY